MGKIIGGFYIFQIKLGNFDSLSFRDSKESSTFEKGFGGFCFCFFLVFGFWFSIKRRDCEKALLPCDMSMSVVLHYTDANLRKNNSIYNLLIQEFLFWEVSLGL